MRHLCVVAFKNKKICARDWSTSLFQNRLKQEEESHWKPNECGVPLFILSVFCPPSFFPLCSRHFPDESPWTKGEKRQQAGSALQSRDFHWVRWWVAFPLQPSNHIQRRDWRGARHIWSSLQLTPHWGGDGVGRVGLFGAHGLGVGGFLCQFGEPGQASCLRSFDKHLLPPTHGVVCWVCLSLYDPTLMIWISFTFWDPQAWMRTLLLVICSQKGCYFPFYRISIPSGRHRLILCQSETIKVKVICWEFSELMKALCGGAYSSTWFKGLTGASMGFHKRASDAVTSATCSGGEWAQEKSREEKKKIFSVHSPRSAPFKTI